MWILVLLLNRGVLINGKRPHHLDVKLRIEYFNL